MSRMIPPFIKENVASNAERKIFSALQKLDYDCTVLHSLGIANHRSKVFGEIDFVIISKEGVLCLEIKGGQVFREEGLWHFIDRYGNENVSAEGPFNQVIGSMFSLRDYFKKNLGGHDPLYRCQYACGVVFPDIPFNQKGPDIIPEIVYDARYTDDELFDYIKKVFKYWRKNCLKKSGFEGEYLSEVNIKKAESLLRGNFGVIPSMNYMLDEIDNQLLAITEEQYSRLEALEDNDRVIIKGGAGTGKTLIGIEHARRIASRSKRVLYICFNKMLANYLKRDIEEKSSFLIEKLDIYHFHGFISRYIDTTDFIQYKDIQNYYNEELPERFMDYVSYNDVEDKYDVVIIDEGQDLLKINYLICINEILNNGLHAGKWYIFYDPNQNIYNKEFEEGLKEIKKYDPAIYNLNTNCRNTKQIGIYNTLLSGVKHEKYLKVNGENVTRQCYEDIDDLRSKLKKLIKNLKSQGVNTGDVVILSPYTFENSCLEGENIFNSICSFQNITGINCRAIVRESLKFSTIQSFKGMEARVVILVDMDKFDDINRKLLNYTAISRAKSLLYIFYDKNAEEEMNKMILDGYKILADDK